MKIISHWRPLPSPPPQGYKSRKQLLGLRSCSCLPAVQRTQLLRLRSCRPHRGGPFSDDAVRVTQATVCHPHKLTGSPNPDLAGVSWSVIALSNWGKYTFYVCQKKYCSIMVRPSYGIINKTHVHYWVIYGLFFNSTD